jgi:hypothetical protein
MRLRSILRRRRGGKDGVGAGAICAGPLLSLPTMGCFPQPRPMRRPVDPLGGEPPTGELYA